MSRKRNQSKKLVHPSVEESPKERDMAVHKSTEVQLTERKFKIMELFNIRYIKGWEHMDQEERATAALALKGLTHDVSDPSNYEMRQYRPNDPGLWYIGLF